MLLRKTQGITGVLSNSVQLWICEAAAGSHTYQLHTTCMGLRYYNICSTIVKARTSINGRGLALPQEDHAVAGTAITRQ